MEEQILENENTDVQEEENIISEFTVSSETETVSMVIQPEEIMFSSSCTSVFSFSSICSSIIKSS